MRYFFHVQEGKRHFPDEIGEDLPGTEAAWQEATVTAGQLLHDLGGALKPGEEWRMRVTDDAGNLIWVLCLSVERH
jgi:hypothetical protein